MIIHDSQIVFTTGTSTSKVVENGDPALFFDLHSNPQAFDEVIKREDITYSTFHNEWGEGRMVLVPLRDKAGRLYMYGASVQLDKLDALLAQNARYSLFLFLLAITGGAALSYVVSAPLARIVSDVSHAASDIAEGRYGQGMKTDRRIKEFTSLATNLNSMSLAIKAHRNELLKARDEAESASRTKSEFLTNMSHELRTPLNGVIGMGDLLLSHELSPDQKERVEIILSSAHQLLDLLNDILDLSKVESGKMEIDVIETDVRTALDLTIPGGLQNSTTRTSSFRLR